MHFFKLSTASYIINLITPTHAFDEFLAMILQPNEVK